MFEERVFSKLRSLGISSCLLIPGCLMFPLRVPQKPGT